MKSKTIISFFSVAALLVVALIFGCSESKGKPGGSGRAGNGWKVPDFTLFDLKGEKVRSTDFLGKVVLIDFWATWCSPCRAEIPKLNDLYKQYRKDGFLVVGISLDHKSPEEIKKFLEKLGVEYTNLMGDQAIMEAFGRIPDLGPIRGIPTVFVVDRQGRICKRFVGLTEKKNFEEAIRGLL